MTIIECINRADALKFNNYTQDEKIAWLSTLDGKIKTEVIDTHEGEKVEFSGYNSETPHDTMLLAPAPYDELYLRYIEAQVDYANGEMGKYNNAMAMFSAAYSEYARWYNRTHKPKQTSLKFF